MATLGSTQPPSVTDPYSNWHSDNIGPNGSNFCKFSHPTVDDSIDQIRITIDQTEQQRLFDQLQEIFRKEQPALFLLAPKERIATLAHAQIQPSAMRPGFFPNLVEMD